MRKVRLLAVAGLFLVAVGCGGGAAPTQVPGSTLVPGATATLPGATTPTATIAATVVPPATTGGPVSVACAGIPPLDPLASPQPELTRDPDLEALFPDEVDGQPVENVNSFRWLEYLCRFGNEGAADVAAGAAAAAGVNLLTLTYGSARATVDDESVGIDAFRTPGVDANLLITQFQQVVLVLGGTAAEQGGSMAQANIGGKNAWVWTQPDNDATYLYVYGDVMFGMTLVTEAQAAAVFAALP